MASNPMQKKSRNSFLLGMLLMLIIAAIAMIFMFLLLTRNNKKEEEKQVAQKDVYVVSTAIQSGGDIEDAYLKISKVNEDMIPDDAYGPNNLLDLYREVVDSNGELVYAPKYKSKIDILPGTVLTEKMLYEGEALQDSERIQEYNMLRLPVQIEPGEYVDIRIHTSTGQDFIIASHKKVMGVSLNTIWLQMKEEETTLMSSAIVDAYISPAMNLYVTRYVEPGMQNAATVTYVPSDLVNQTIKNNPNITSEAKEVLNQLYSSDIGNGMSYRDYYRSWLNNEIKINYEEEKDRLESIQAKMVEDREKALEEREAFLNGIQ